MGRAFQGLVMGSQERRVVDGACHILLKVSIANVGAVAEAYGPEAAELLGAALAERVEQFTHGWAMLEHGPGTIDILVFDPLGLAARHGLADASDMTVLAALLSELAAKPVSSDGVEIIPLVVAVAGSVEPFSPQVFAAIDADLTRRLHAATPLFGSLAAGDAVRALYASDMAVAATISAAFADERVLLLWEPVAAADEGMEILYHVGVARMVGAGGKVREPDSFIPALERTGLIREFDMRAMRMTIDRLRTNPNHRLGCRLSVQSAVIDGWWSAILSELEEEPDVAERLVVEIASGPLTPATDLVVAFADRLRWLGCAIGVDALGSSLTSLDHAFRPDIIKIAAAHLARAVERASEQDLDRLRHLIGLAKTLATNVVVEGVEDEVRLRAACLAGAHWFRGARLGSPSFTLRAPLAASAAAASALYAPKPGLACGGPEKPW